MNICSLGNYYEAFNNDIIIEPDSENSVKVSLVKYKLSRILDDDYLRLDGMIN